MNKRRFFRLVFILILFNLISCQKKELHFSSWERIASDLNFPEGPAWDGKSRLVLSNCYGGWLTEVINGSVDTFLIAGAKTFSKTNTPGHQLFITNFH